MARLAVCTPGDSSLEPVGDARDVFLDEVGQTSLLDCCCHFLFRSLTCTVFVRG